MAASTSFRRLHDEWTKHKEEWARCHAAWVGRHEAARERVDRIAYCGKVPVNVMGAKPGDYIEAAEGPDDTIIGITSKTSGPNTVGRVRKILEDGRALLAVGV